MNYKWYVVHVYSGSEKRVKETLEEQMKSKNMEDFIEEILVPTEEILEIRKGAKVKTEKKFFLPFCFTTTKAAFPKKKIVSPNLVSYIFVRTPHFRNGN